MPVEQIPIGPGRTSLAKDEFILEFKLPPRPPRSGDAYLRFIPRTEMDIAVVGCGVNVTLDAKRRLHRGARRRWARSRRPCCWWRTAAEALIGHTLDDATLARARRRGARGLQADQRQARHHRLPHQGRRRAGAPRRRHRVRPRAGQVTPDTTASRTATEHR